ncbi:MAG: hypothetical protein ACTSVI_05700 [Promethearchaeota archaeon]
MKKHSRKQLDVHLTWILGMAWKILAGKENPKQVISGILNR